MLVPTGLAALSESPVFIVDDDKLVLEIMSDTLRNAGYPTSTFHDPRAALEALGAERPAVIIADYTMPFMDGVSFLAQARERVPDATRVLCTGATEFDVALSAVNSGEVYRIVRKPCPPEALLAITQSAVLRADDDRLTRELGRKSCAPLSGNEQRGNMAQQRAEILLDGLIAALDCRDADSQWHSRRVSRYARRLAMQLGIQEPELTVIEKGALLHDIGKIGMLDEVLRKPGALTPREWEDVRKHAANGWSLLQCVEHLRPSATLVLQHHERWDGTGYPNRLSGEEITLGARIFHVVDALDAITSDRPYRQARSLQEARRKIKAGAGGQFDPRVVRAFLEIDPAEFVRIRTEVETVEILSAEILEKHLDAASRVDAGGASQAGAGSQWAKKRLGEILVETRMIDGKQLETALQYQRWHGGKLGTALVKLGFLTEERVLAVLARKLGYERIRLDSLRPSPSLDAALRLIPPDVARAKGVIPVGCDKATITVALHDPANLTLVDELAFRTGRRVKAGIASEGEVTRAIDRLYFERPEVPLELELARDEDELHVLPLCDVSSWLGGAGSSGT